MDTTPRSGFWPTRLSSGVWPSSSLKSSFFTWADVHEIAAQGAFPGMMRRIDSLMAENLSIKEKLKDAAIGEEKAVEMTEVLKKENMHMNEEITKLRQLKVVLVIIILLSWAPTIFKWMG
ncbi:hypothetical protein ACS0TY_012354 [Phlomoides rotata]